MTSKKRPLSHSVPFALILLTLLSTPTLSQPLRFTPDAAVLDVFRLPASNSTTQSITEVSLVPGTAYPNMYSVPTNVPQIPYPAYYRQLRTQTLFLEDPYCPLTQDVVAYPAAYLDIAKLPDITSAPLSASIKRAVGLKDFWFGEPGAQVTCGQSSPNVPTMRDAYTSTLGRLRALGADYVAPTQSFWIDGLDNPHVVLAPGYSIPEVDLEFIAHEAKRVGLEVVLRINLAAGVVTTIPSRTWYSTFLNSYSDLLVTQAALAQKYGVSAIQLNWDGWGANDVTVVLDIINTRMLQTVQDVRRVYSGKILISEQMFWGDLPEDVFNAIDMIMIAPIPVLPPEKINDFTMDDLRDLYAGELTKRNQRLSRFNKPLWLAMFIQSHPDFLVTGWLEEGFCLPGCPQLNIRTDFASQAMAYEALFEAATAAHAEGNLRLGAVESNGYWYSDPLMPPAAINGQGMFPNLSQNVRNKPAESIVFQWFKRTTVAPPAADFTFFSVTPKAGQSIQFTDTSTGGPTSWSWDFGDGYSSTAQNPTHVFATAGAFTVTLTASNAGGSNATTKTVTVASAGASTCVEDATTMCLVGGRYRVRSHWRNQYAGGAVSTLSKAKLTDTTGAFWIANADMYEYLIRFNTATDNGRTWIAIPTFTDVEFWIDVTDTVTGQSNEYHSASGNKTLIYDPYFFVYP